MMAKIKSHRDLIAWQKAMDLAEDAYHVTSEFPREEVYRLTLSLVTEVSKMITAIRSKLLATEF